jgi:hypothetical protein
MSFPMGQFSKSAFGRAALDIRPTGIGKTRFLFPDTKAGENFCQNVLHAGFARNLIEFPQSFSQIDKRKFLGKPFP